jgi:hypothetical protein
LCFEFVLTIFIRFLPQKKVCSWSLSLNIIIIHSRPAAVIGAWDLPFKGQAHELLMIAIDEANMAEGSDYAKILPIIQSSGTGKSKAVDAMAMERIVLQLCIRENVEPYAFGRSCDLDLAGWLTLKFSVSLTG